MIAHIGRVAQVRMQFVGKLARNLFPVIIDKIQRVIRPDLARLKFNLQLQREAGIVVSRVIEDIGRLKDIFSCVHRLQRLTIFDGQEPGAVVVFIGQ